MNLTLLTLTMNFKSIVTLTTIPERINPEERGNDPKGIRKTLDVLLSQTYDNYEVHLNIPYVSIKTGKEYILPSWISDLDPKLKILRTDDFGSITKIAPTLKRVTDPEQIIIICDDDIIYHEDMVRIQTFNQQRFPGAAVGYDGMKALDPRVYPDEGDVRKHFVTSVNKNVQVLKLQGYKTISLRRKYFDDSFFTDFVGKSWCDDTVISSHLSYMKVPRIVTWHPRDPVLNTIEEWREFGGACKSFPAISSSSHGKKEGCNLFRAERINPAGGDDFLSQHFKNEKQENSIYPYT